MNSHDQTMIVSLRMMEARNPRTTPDRLDVLANDQNAMVRWWVARNRTTTPETRERLTMDPDASVRHEATKRRRVAPSPPPAPNPPAVSLRDWFAGREQLSDFDNDLPPIPAAEALAGRKMPQRADYQSCDGWERACWEWNADWRAKLRYIRADAMLRAGGHA